MNHSNQPKSSSNPSSSSQLQAETPPFTFVYDKNQPGTRAHAMRAYWSERRKRKEETESSTHQFTNRRLIPKSESLSEAEIQETSYPNEDPDTHASSVYDSWALDDQNETLIGDKRPSLDAASVMQSSGVPMQFLTGVEHALGSSRLDPFDMFPVTLTSQHFRLLNHWLSAHATMMFEPMPASHFNPMRDVWFPLDLSNAASFNAMMAYSAAHLAYYYGGSASAGGTNSSETLKYKANAVRIVNRWLQDPTMALSNDTFAAVTRLLSFERCWGTEEEWKVHRDGLQRMIEARGGLHELRVDWRLELVVGLVSLMSRPSWFVPQNKLPEIARGTIRNEILSVGIDFHKMRSLWLISFIQDMRNLMAMLVSSHRDGLSVFPSLHDTIQFIRTNFTDKPTSYVASDYDRMACLFSICIMVQESVSLTSTAPNNSLAVLNMSLHNGWHSSNASSIHDLRAFLHRHFLGFYLDGPHKVEYVMQIADIVSQLSLEAHRGIEKCLLNMLCRTREGKLIFVSDEGATPDSLLSSIHGG